MFIFNIVTGYNLQICALYGLIKKGLFFGLFLAICPGLFRGGATAPGVPPPGGDRSRGGAVRLRSCRAAVSFGYTSTTAIKTLSIDRVLYFGCAVKIQAAFVVVVRRDRSGAVPLSGWAQAVPGSLSGIPPEGDFRPPARAQGSALNTPKR